MAIANDISAPLRHADRFFIGGEWVKPSSDAVIDVIDSTSEQLFFSVAEAKEARHGAGRCRRPPGVRPGTVAPPEPRAAGRVPARHRAPSWRSGPRTWARSGPGSPACSTPSPRGPSPAPPGRSTTTPGWPRRSPSRRRRSPAWVASSGSSSASPSASWARSSLERPPRPHHLQDRPRPPGRLHRHPQGLTRSSGRGLRHGGDRRGGRPPAGRAQCRDGRPGGVRAPGARPPRRQDHLHRVDGRRAADRLHSAGSGSPAAPWSWAASPPPSSSTTWTWPPRPPRWPAPSASSPDRSAPR